MAQKHARKIRSLREDLKIDKLNLPAEWEKHPEIYRYWAEEYAISVLARDAAKEKLDLIAADLDLDIRANPKAYCLKKLAESSIKSSIKIQSEHKEAQEEYNRAKYQVTRMQAAKDAMEHRRDALKHLNGLALAGFYSANTAPPESSVNKGRTMRDTFNKRMTAKQRRTIVS